MTNDVHETELGRWWAQVARQEVEAVVPKALEYGSTDLAEIGRQLQKAMDPDLADRLDPGQVLELGIYFYVIGKVARWTDAIRRGESVSDDTIHDIAVYCRMVQRVRAAGGWPGLGDYEGGTSNG